VLDHVSSQVGSFAKVESCVICSDVVEDGIAVVIARDTIGVLVTRAGFVRNKGSEGGVIFSITVASTRGAVITVFEYYLHFSIYSSFNSKASMIFTKFSLLTETQLTVLANLDLPNETLLLSRVTAEASEAS
jgi:hypothetical protein